MALAKASLYTGGLFLYALISLISYSFLVDPVSTVS